jgi:hypothetical protein
VYNDADPWTATGAIRPLPFQGIIILPSEQKKRRLARLNLLISALGVSNLRDVTETLVDFLLADFRYLERGAYLKNKFNLYCTIMTYFVRKNMELVTFSLL